MRPTSVHITQEHIDFGRQQNNASCAIALALKEADPEIERVVVTEEYITFSYRGDDMRYRLTTPNAQKNFIRKFDPEGGRQRVRPQTFTVDTERAVKAWPVQHATSGASRMMRQAGRPHAPGTGKPSSHRPIPD
jgi:hypothetical protein